MLPNKTESLDWAHPLVRDWFTSEIGWPTEPQQHGWPHILAGRTTLISAPTGSGKTLAAFLACIDRLVRQSLSGNLPEQTQVIYISPLKALSNDIQKNLMAPLNQIRKLAEERGFNMQEIRIALRTGDTLPRDRQTMLKKPPHILVTTPESLYILLTAEKSRAMLSDIKTVIVDEIHALANNKRGSHLALSLERLDALIQYSPVRIGLSATQKPIELVARFLAGSKRPLPQIVNIGHARHLELAIETPVSELGAVASNEMWDEIYDRIAELAKQNRSTLVFVNTRRLSERIAHHLAERLGDDQVAAHHGSLSRKIRHTVESKLKQGELKVLVATASLELGIDIGTVDLVCQIGSPRAIAIALQRVGRAGHWHGAISRGRFFVTTRDELMECAALLYAIQQGDLDRLIIPEQPIDVLTQQIIAICATGEWREKDLFELTRRAYPYRNLSRDTFNTVLEMLSEGVAGSRGRYGAYLFRDRVNGLVKPRRGIRMTAIMNGGAIPENGLFTVIAEPNNVMVGTLDEDFAVESNRGDIILLGTTSWQIKRIESAAGRVLVENAHGAPPSVPFWRGEAPARTDELSWYVSDLRQKLNDRLPNAEISHEDIKKHPKSSAAIAWLKKHCGLDTAGAEQLIDYLVQGRAILGAVPTQQTVIAERFFDEGGGMQLIIHAPFGARINKAWGLALRKRFCRSFNFELQAAATDNGLNIALAEQHSFPLTDVFQFLHPHSTKEVLTQAVLQAPLFTTRWRWTATRSLALVRFRYGKKIPPNIQRMLSDDLLAAVFPDAAACQDNLGGRDIELPDHPLINEAIKDTLTEALDLDGFLSVLNGIGNGSIQCLAIDTPVPSPFSHEILNANPYAFLDDAPLEERRARAVEMRRILPESVLQEAGKLDQAAIDEVQREVWPDIRNADELHDLLQTLIAFPQPDTFTERPLTG
ncbi:DEAD/DEAH box helicase [Aquicella lusitana]|uniref:Lhr-like helicase n=1 Tax=Aquicella lusitana TaxID=254246 RepID=A0A370GFL2_9COXI|nr:DEAD/DEAH box helicase [Aquicella lusitana]RDI42602.1 Lhr-like helicase [Aquicella lusitana]VVC74380.1 putative ATP-dependent RNA helicase YfmL [Aquicella lusitana]